MCVQKLKFVALSVPEIIGGTHKKLGSPCIRPRSIFSPIFNWLLFISYHIISYRIVHFSGASSKTQAPQPLNKQVRTLRIYLPNLKFVASKSWGVPGLAHAPYSPKF